MTETLNKLAQLTEQLPELDQLEIPIGGPVVAFKQAGENANVGLGFGVYRDSQIGMMRGFMPKGLTIDPHVHRSSHEWVGVIHGKLRITFLDTMEEITVADCEAVHIAPGRPHITAALEDTWRWSVTVPPAAGYPDIGGCPILGTDITYLQALAR